MKKLIAFVSAALSATTLLASPSPAATQEWVKNYVATNVQPVKPSTEVEPTKLTILNDQGQQEQVIVNWTMCTNDALRVTWSNVDGMPNDITFAKMDGNRYYNATNYTCANITGSTEIVRMVFTGAKKVVIGGVTNQVYTGTNYVYDTVYRARIGGTEYTSFRVSDGMFIFQPNVTTVDNRKFYMGATKVSDITKKKITTLPTITFKQERRFSFFELLFPSAYAISPGQPEGPTEHKFFLNDEEVAYEDIPVGATYQIKGKYLTRYYTDADEAKPYSMGTIEWIDAMGNKQTYTIDLILCEIQAGVEITSFTEDDFIEISDDDLKGELEKVLPRSRFIQLTRGAAWESVRSRKNQLVAEYNATVTGLILEAQRKDPYPEESWEVEGTYTKECINHVWRGQCGNWTCLKCMEKKTSPSTHTYGTSTTQCDVCLNQADAYDPYSICGGTERYRPQEFEHHRGWHDYGGKCVCACYVMRKGAGGYALDHFDPFGSETNVWADSYICDPVTKDCYRVWHCGRCGVCNVDGSSVPSRDKGLTCTAASHAETSDAKYVCADEHGTPTAGGVYCKLEAVCDHSQDQVEQLRATGCGADHSSLMEHDPDESYEIVTDIGSDEYHKSTKPCSHGFFGWNNPTNVGHWCGYVTNDTEAAHNYAYGAQGGRIGKAGEGSLHEPSNTHHYRYDVCGDWMTGQTNSPHTCGHVKMIAAEQHAHSWQDFYGDPNATTHAVSNHCGVCEKDFIIRREAHYIDNQQCFDVGNPTQHAVTNFCLSCVDRHVYPKGYPWYGGLSNHVAQVGGDVYAWIGNNNYHEVSNLCAECHGYFKATPPYDAHNRIGADFYGNGHETYHHVSNHCTKCDHDYWVRTEYHDVMKADRTLVIEGAGGYFHDEYGDDSHDIYSECRRCSQIFYDKWERCDKNGGWFENPNVNGRDRGICDKCGGTNYYDHTWVMINTNEHSCANQVFGAKTYPHVFTNDVCVYCGYDRSIPIPVEVENCACGCGCWRHMYNGEVFDTNCLYPNWTNGKCGCASCQSGTGADCLCETVRYMLCLGDYPRVTANQFKSKYIGCGYRWVNGDDPVYHVCTSGFEDAFQNSLSLVKVTFNALTNCEANAFKGAFRGCTNLTTVQFSALRKTGAYAFAGAFVNCGPIDKMVFSNLTDAADGTFDNAFIEYYNPTEIVEFRAPKMKNYKAIDISTFHHYDINDNLKIIDLRALEVAPWNVGNISDSVEYLYFNNATNTWDGNPLIYIMNADTCKLEELHLDSSSRFWRDADPTCTTIIERDNVTLPWWTMIFVPSAHYYNYIHTGYYDRIFSNFYPARGSDEFIYTKFGTAMKSADTYDICVTCRCDVAGLTVNDFEVADAYSTEYSISSFEEIRPKWYSMRLNSLRYGFNWHMIFRKPNGAYYRWVEDQWTHTESAP